MGIGFHFDDIERSAFGLDADEDVPIGGFHDDDVLSFINATHEKETEIVPSQPVFWAKQWKCLNCNELIDLPEMTDVCDYKYCPYCGGKNTICGKTMEELHIREDDESESTTD